jgi:DNA-binding IclR family transcriptional regulator
MRKSASASKKADAAADTVVAAVDRALQILLAFQSGESGISLALLAERTGMYKSTILRLIQTLERRKFIVRLEDGRYRLGATVFQLGGVYQNSFPLREVIMPHLTALTDKIGESSSFFISDGETKTCLFRVEPKNTFLHVVEVGRATSIALGSTGQVLQSFASGAAQTAPDVFKKLPMTMAGTNPLELSSISGPVFGPGGELKGAVSISGPTGRFDRKAQAAATQVLLKALETITEALGGDPNVFGVRFARKSSR